VLVYTSATPRPLRERRRDEMRSHLWEAESAGVASRRVAAAALRGVAADVSWALSAGVLAVLRSFGGPTPYVVLAAICPLQAWVVSTVASQPFAHLSEGAGAIGGPALLLLAVLVWTARRTRRH
jgi:hypothetical protein